jgi:hypothetical protein
MLIRATAGQNEGIIIDKGSSISATNVQFNISHRSNNTDILMYGYDGTDFYNWMLMDYANERVSFSYPIISESDITIPAEAYSSDWNGKNEAATKNDVYDKIETMSPETPYKSIVIQVYIPSANVVAGTGVAYISIPKGLDGWDFDQVAATVYTVDGSYAVGAVVLKSTNHSAYSTVATATITAGSYEGTTTSLSGSVAEGNKLRIDVTYSGSATAKGLDVRIDFTK